MQLKTQAGGEAPFNDYRDDPLWLRLASFDLDVADAAYPFSRRLAFENRWSYQFADRVIEEYKRFCYLGVTAGHPVTPSDQVDQAWHLHLLYLRNYWDVFCGEVLQTPFSHGPTEGGRAEDMKFRDWYEKTKASYRETFGTAPPDDIWPSSDIRFDRRTSFHRIETPRYLVIPNPFVAENWKSLYRALK